MEYRGHQIYIIHPDRDFRETAVQFLRDKEYETFGFGDTDPVVLDNRRESVIFLHTSPDSDWDCRTLAQSLKNDRDDGDDVHLVALGEGDTSDCFESSVSGTGDELLSGILGFLEHSDARGHRHFVRFGSQNASIATFEFHAQGRRYAGVIHDISVRGMSCTYMPEPEDTGPRRISDMVVNLPGRRCTVSGKMTGRRHVAGHIIHVFMFDREISRETIDDLHEFIYSSLSMKLSVH